MRYLIYWCQCSISNLKSNCDTK